MTKTELDATIVAAVIDAALKEDMGTHGDITSDAVVPEDAILDLAMNARQDLVLAGLPVAVGVFRRLAPTAEITTEIEDGTAVKKGTTLLRVKGPARGLLAAERTALNIVQFLSGISTLTRQYVKEIEGTGCVLLDVRKTAPGLRDLSKYATRMGGATNHRMRLDDGVLIKDNHLLTCGGLSEAVGRAKAANLKKIEVECDTLEQVQMALDAGTDSILLDNMGVEMLERAVKLVDGRVPLEASGGITIENIRERAETGVDFVSTGRITQSAPGVDIGLDLIEHS